MFVGRGGISGELERWVNNAEIQKKREREDRELLVILSNTAYKVYTMVL